MARYGAIEYAEPMGDKAFVRTNPCPVCGRQHEFELDREAFEAWQTDTHIQNAFPDMSADDREILISGTCGPCWDRLWGVE